MATLQRAACLPLSPFPFWARKAIMHDVAKVSELFDTDLWALDFWYLRGSHGVTVGTAVMLRW